MRQDAGLGWMGHPNIRVTGIKVTALPKMTKIDLAGHILAAARKNPRNLNHHAKTS